MRFLGVARNRECSIAYWAEPDFVRPFALPHNVAARSLQQADEVRAGPQPVHVRLAGAGGAPEQQPHERLAIVDVQLAPGQKPLLPPR